MRRLPLPLRGSPRWRSGNRTRFTFPEPLEEERLAAAAVREVSGRSSSHAESAAGPGSNFVSFCREQNLGPRQGAPLRGERWAAEAALEQRMGRKLGQESWATRGWVMGVPPEPTRTPPSTGAGPPVGEQRQRALADWVMGGGGGGPSAVGAASTASTARTAAPASATAVQPLEVSGHERRGNSAAQLSEPPLPEHARLTAAFRAAAFRAKASEDDPSRPSEPSAAGGVAGSVAGHPSPNPNPNPSPSPSPSPSP